LSDAPAQPSAATSEQVKIEELARFYIALGKVLTESGLNGEALNEVFSGTSAPNVCNAESC